MPLRGSQKYAPLADHLGAQPATVASLTLTLPQIEALLGAPLPATAELTGWWVSSTGAHVRQWRRAGWRAARRTAIDGVAAVTFERLPPH